MTLSVIMNRKTFSQLIVIAHTSPRSIHQCP